MIKIILDWFKTSILKIDYRPIRDGYHQSRPFSDGQAVGP